MSMNRKTCRDYESNIWVVLLQMERVLRQLKNKEQRKRKTFGEIYCSSAGKAT